MKARVLIYDDGKVSISDQALKLSPFSFLYKSDRTKDRNRFQDAITFLYFMYCKESIFFRRTPLQRRDYIAGNVFKKTPDYIDKIESMEGFAEARDFYIADQLNEDEWAYEQWKMDVEQYLVYLRDIPYTITTKKNVEGILVDTSIDNSAVKMPAVKHFGELIDLGKKIRDRVKETQKKNAVGNREKKMFEDPI